MAAVVSHVFLRSSVESTPCEAFFVLVGPPFRLELWYMDLATADWVQFERAQATTDRSSDRAGCIETLAHPGVYQELVRRVHQHLAACWRDVAPSSAVPASPDELVAEPPAFAPIDANAGCPPPSPDTQTCLVCMYRIANVCVRPCLHRVSCNICHAGLDPSKCILCRQETAGEAELWVTQS